LRLWAFLFGRSSENVHRFSQTIPAHCFALAACTAVFAGFLAVV
jgi:hypothetical protein